MDNRVKDEFRLFVFIIKIGIFIDIMVDSLEEENLQLCEEIKNYIMNDQVLIHIGTKYVPVKPIIVNRNITVKQFYHLIGNIILPYKIQRMRIFNQEFHLMADLGYIGNCSSKLKLIEIINIERLQCELLYLVSNHQDLYDMIRLQQYEVSFE